LGALFPDELASRGHRFRSRTDTEALAHGYEGCGIAGPLGRPQGTLTFALNNGRESGRLILGCNL